MQSGPRKPGVCVRTPKETKIRVTISASQTHNELQEQTESERVAQLVSVSALGRGQPLTVLSNILAHFSQKGKRLSQARIKPACVRGGLEMRTEGGVFGEGQRAAGRGPCKRRRRCEGGKEQRFSPLGG